MESMKEESLMTNCTRLIFDLLPAAGAGECFMTPYTYIFRGILLDWLNESSHELANKVHTKQPKDTPLFYGDYSLQQQTLYLGPQGLTDHNPKVRDPRDSKNYHRKEGIQALRFTLNLFNPELSKAFFEMLLSSQNQTVQFGPQQAVIARVSLENITLENLAANTRPVHAVELNFLSPTNFSMMGNDFELRFPQPEYVFGNLYKQWNHLFQNTSLEIDPGFYEWVKGNVWVTSYELQTVGWEMGKEKKFVGFRGWANFVIKESDQTFARWIDVLMHFGMYTGIGNSRTAGFGRFIIRNINYSTELTEKLGDAGEINQINV
jgi:CRISPR-associated endoribonuclease Cas6